MRACWYHANCFDGFGAAYLLWRRYGRNTLFEAVQHGQELPPITDDITELWLLDITFDQNQMNWLDERLDWFVVIDHHVSAERVLRGVEADVQIFDTQHSAAYLTHRYLWPDVGPETIPLLIDYIEDRDLWTWALPRSREVNAYIRSWPFCFETFSKIETSLELDFDGCARQGEAILRQMSRMVSLCCDNAVTVVFEEHRVPCVSATVLQSEIGHELLERHPEAPFSISFFDDMATKKRIYQLRSRKGGFDCSELAQRYGGGGHQSAAGFTVPIANPVEAIVHSK